jgi:hypothetical protein
MTTKRKLGYEEARKIFRDYRKKNEVNNSKEDLEKSWFNFTGELLVGGYITLKERNEWISKARFR